MTADGLSWERSIVERIVAGDESALAEVFDEIGPLVHGIAVCLVGSAHAADIVQEVFVSLWDRPERFDPARGSLRALLVTIARRRCIDHLRRHGRQAATEQRAARARPGVAPDVEAAVVGQFERDDVRAALASLPAAQRRAVELAYFEGMTFREVATATGVSEGTAKSRIRLALQRLASVLYAHDERRSG